MNIPRHALQMFGILFVLSVVVGGYTGWRHSMPIQEILVGGLFGGVVLGLGGAILYSLGIKKASYLPTLKGVAMHGLFSYFMAYSASVVFGLANISWFLFAALVAVLSFASAIRLKSMGGSVG